VIVLKAPFDLYATKVDRAIGHPISITQNLASKSFPESYDLKIPASADFCQIEVEE
jgi:hypothetical protein